MTRRPRPNKLGKKVKRARSLLEQLDALGPAPSYDNVFTVEEAAEVARQRVRWDRQRAAITEAHRKRQQLSDPLMVQERHSPTVEIAVDDPAGKRRARRNITRVRQSEAWRHNNLDGMQHQAETELHLVWKTLTAGLATSRMVYDIVPAGSYNTAAIDRALALEQVWREWIGEAARRRINVSVVLMILTEPTTLSVVEKACRLKRGQAIEVYRRGLDLWAELRGWLRPAMVHPIHDVPS